MGMVIELHKILKLRFCEVVWYVGLLFCHLNVCYFLCMCHDVQSYVMINIVGAGNDVVSHEGEAISYYKRYLYDCAV